MPATSEDSLNASTVGVIFIRMKILLTGVLGGIVMFVWTSIAHTALPLGEAGRRNT